MSTYLQYGTIDRDQKVNELRGMLSIWEAHRTAIVFIIVVFALTFAFGLLMLLLKWIEQRRRRDDADRQGEQPLQTATATDRATGDDGRLGGPGGRHVTLMARLTKLGQKIVSAVGGRSGRKADGGRSKDEKLMTVDVQ